MPAPNSPQPDAEVFPVEGKEIACFAIKSVANYLIIYGAMKYPPYLRVISESLHNLRLYKSSAHK